MEQDNPAFNRSEELDQDRNENFRHDNDLQEPPSVIEGGFSSVITNDASSSIEETTAKIGRPPKPKHYFDVFTGSVIDRKFYKFFERSGVNPENVRDLGVLLRETQVPKRPTSYRRLDTSKSASELSQFNQNEYSAPESYTQSKVWNWPEERYKRYGRWLNKSVATSNINHHQLNEKVIKQAAKLGLGPGTSPLEDTFGSVRNFYKEINAKQSPVRGRFNDWSTEKFIKHIQKVGQKTGRRPSREILKEWSKSNPWAYPSPKTIARNFGGELSSALELSGYKNIRNWTPEDYIDWGVKFMKANNGMEITWYPLHYLSTKDVGPSAHAVKENVGLQQFKDQAKVEYLTEIAAEEEERQRKLAEIEEMLGSEKLPRELFESAESENDLIYIYAKYQVVRSLCPESEESTKIIVSTRGFYEVGFVGSIRKVNNAISTGDIESAALCLEVFDDIWPIDGYMETLKLDEGYDEFREYQRQRDKVRTAKNKERREQNRKVWGEILAN
jgi:hypothetical protein